MDKLTIIQMHLEGKSNRKIAKSLGLNRKTVNKYINEYIKAANALTTCAGSTDSERVRSAAEQITAAPAYKPRKHTPRKWNKEMDSFLDKILAEEEEKRKFLRTSKQQLRNVQIHQLMLDQGFDIGITTVSNKIKEKRTKTKEAFIAQSYPYGQRFEYDFGEVRLNIKGEFTKLFIAVMCAPASDYRFAVLYNNQKFDVFLDSQVKFFEHIGGCFEEGVYDNMRNVVSKFIGRNEKEINEKLLSFAAYYGFKVNVTNCFSGNEKGSVERSVDIVRNKAFAANWKFDSIEEAQAHLDKALAKLNEDKNLEAEKAHLSPYRPPFEVADIRTCVNVNKYSCIQIDKVFYSVPDTLVGKSVIAKVYPKEIIVLFNQEIVAKHTRSRKEGDMVLDIMHYLHTLIRKPGALRNATALSANAKLKAIFDEMYSENPREFVEILHANKDRDIEQIINALKNHGVTISPQDQPHCLNKVESETLKQISSIMTVGRRVA
jgi:transposase/biotin operon repressor